MNAYTHGLRYTLAHAYTEIPCYIYHARYLFHYCYEVENTYRVLK